MGLIEEHPKGPTLFLFGVGFFVGLIMKPFAEAFYKSKAWQSCRDAYMDRAGRLCEPCLAAGRYTPAEIIHHIVELTPENINDPSITLNFGNLQAVCRECHSVAHGARQRRYKIDELGRVTATR